VLSALRGRAGGLASTTAVTVTVMEGKNERVPVRVDHNFQDASMQRCVFRRVRALVPSRLGGSVQRDAVGA
jgi:hypothetical protein